MYLVEHIATARARVKQYVHTQPQCALYQYETAAHTIVVERHCNSTTTTTHPIGVAAGWCCSRVLNIRLEALLAHAVSIFSVCYQCKNVLLLLVLVYNFQEQLWQIGKLFAVSSVYQKKSCDQSE
jgi:hypothetical protein